MTSRALVRGITGGSLALIVCAIVAGPSGARPPRSHFRTRPAAISHHLPAPDGGDKLTGKFPVAFLLCNYKNWTYRPNPVSYYEPFWTARHAGKFESLPDYFADESYGALSMAGSRVLGWYPMKVSENTWANGNLETVKWLDCANAALAAGANLSSYRSIVSVEPWVRAKVTGSGIADWTSASHWPSGQAHPNPETFTVDSTAHWPSPPFYLTVPIGTYGQSSLVTKVSGDTVTVIRGEGATQDPLAQLTAVSAGGYVNSNTNDDQAYVGPLDIYLNPHAQPCASGHSTCSEFSLDQKNNGALVHVGMAALQTGNLGSDDAYTNGIGDSAHEVGHTTGYVHSRTLSTSTTEYQDCFDQMSYNCGLPDLPTAAGPPDDIESYDAINLEWHGWIPTSKQFNSANATVHQSTITLHALSDPNALNDSGYLDAHLPASVQIEDASPKNASPTVPPTCSTGYLCEDSSYYTVEYRQKYGFDAELDPPYIGSAPTRPSVPSGAVLLHLAVGDPNNCANGGCNISYLVDSQPGLPRRDAPKFLPNDGALQPGMDYADPANDVYVAVNSFDAAAKDAKVTVSSAPIKANLKVTGNTAGTAGASAKLSAVLSVGGAAVPDQTVSLSLASGQMCSAATNSSGDVSCSVTLGSTAGDTAETASFSGDQAYASAVGSATFQVWSAQTPLTLAPSIGDENAPSIAAVGSSWLAAWRDAKTHEIYYSVDSGKGWSPAVVLDADGTIPTTSLAPAVGSIEGGLPVIAWTTSSGTIDYSGFALIAWSAPTTVSGSWGSAYTELSPALAGNIGGLTVAWTGGLTHHLLYSKLADAKWSAPVTDTAASSDYSPAVTATTSGSTDIEDFAWTNSNDTIGVLRTDGSTSQSEPDVSDAATVAAPALAMTPTGGTVLISYRGRSSDTVYYRRQSGSSWTTQLYHPQAQSALSPAIAIVGSTVQMLWHVPGTLSVDQSLSGY